MKRAWLMVGSLMSAALFMSCGGGSSPASNPFTPAGSTSLNFIIRDTPPSGVSVLSFEVTVTGAVLHQGTTDVSILGAPVKVEITQLETESAFLSTQGVTPGQYGSITVTFANPEMTILNNSSAAVAGCAVGAVCELKPSLNPASVDFSGPPFPLNLTADTATGLLLDFNLDASVQNDLSIQPAIGFTQLPVVQNEGQLEELEDLSGQITAIGNNQFTLQVAESGQSLIILVDSNTQFEDFGEAGLANAFSSLKVGQAVEVDVRLNGSGSMVAKKVELREVEQEDELEGAITSVDSATQFTMVVLEEVPDLAGVEVGNKVTVTLQDGANFRIDDDGLNIPSDVHFDTSADLTAGQEVDVRPVSGTSGTSIVTDRVRLRMSQFTAQVKSTNGSIIIVDNLPGVFTAAGITQIEVRTDSQTDFDDVSGVGALVAGNKLALEGLLFKRTGDIPVLVAKKVRKL